jgi:CDP-glucose 4,6-dehydratase
VLVTGATGLLGGWVVQALLDAGANVTALCRDRAGSSRLFSEGLASRCRITWGNIEDIALLERVMGEQEVTVVVHLAAQTLVQTAQRNPSSTWATNVGGTAAVLEACRRSPTVAAVTVASSDKVYGDQADTLAESAPLLATDPYGASKVAAEAVARSYAATWGLPVGITRCANFFGGGDRNWSRLVPGTARAAVRGEVPVVRSDGRAVRDWIYVEDGAAGTLAVAAALLADPSLRGRAWNLSMEQPRTVLAVVQAVLRAAGRPDAVRVLNQAPGELPHQALRCDRARAELGFRPSVSWDAALARALAWYRLHLGGAA